MINDSDGFSRLGLAGPLLRAVAESGYDTPTPIQNAAIPEVMGGRDLLAAAQTGTGKTAGFTLPVLHRLCTGEAASIRSAPGKPRCLILTPTRELAAQVAESVALYGKNVNVKSLVVFGGVNIKAQIAGLSRPVDVLIATPGRLLDLVGQGVLKLSAVQIFILDEADRMLDMGFIPDIRRVIAQLPGQRQNLLFSATFSPPIRQLARGLLNNPAEVEVAPRNTASELVEQSVYLVDRAKKRTLLAQLIKDRQWIQVLVFTRTKHGANRLAEQLCKDGIESMAIHGNKSQNARTRALGRFKTGDLPVLVATDIAARGLDIDHLPHVVNYELPNVPEDYVHRIGRTGRAGREGQAVSLVMIDEMKLLSGIEKLLRRPIERAEWDGLTGHTETPTPGGLANARNDRGPRPAGAGGRGRGRSGGGAGRSPAGGRGGARPAPGNSSGAPRRQRRRSTY